MITDNIDTIIKALKTKDSEIYELDEENRNIKRKSEVIEQDHAIRSVHIGGLPLVDVDAEDPIAALFKLQDRVDEAFSEKGKVLCVRLKKTHANPKRFKVRITIIPNKKR